MTMSGCENSSVGQGNSQHLPPTHHLLRSRNILVAVLKALLSWSQPCSLVLQCPGPCAWAATLAWCPWAWEPLRGGSNGLAVTLCRGWRKGCLPRKHCQAATLQQGAAWGRCWGWQRTEVAPQPLTVPAVPTLQAGPARGMLKDTCTGWISCAARKAQSHSAHWQSSWGCSVQRDSSKSYSIQGFLPAASQQPIPKRGFDAFRGKWGS